MKKCLYLSLILCFLSAFVACEEPTEGNMHGNENSTSSSGGNTSNPETDTTDFLYLQTLKGHSSYVLSVSWSPDGRFFASGSWDESLVIWNMETELNLSVTFKNV
jgi:WD40 repeat protein